MATKYAYKKRAFLNDSPELSAFIIATVEKFNRDDDGRRDVYAYPTLDIADCTNKVSLDFCFSGTRGMNTALKKVRLFKKIVDEFADAFEAEAERINKNK